MANYPQAFIDLMDQKFKDEKNAFWESLNLTANTSIRLNPFKTNVIPKLDPVAWNPQGYYVPQDTKFVSDPWWHAGAYYVQEASSMFLSYALQPFLEKLNNPLVLDLCAAPGGKSTLLATEIWKKNGFLVANEVMSNRIGSLQENISKWGLPNTVVTNKDAAFWGKKGPLFDMVLVDAPCSGEGMFRKDPNAILQWNDNSPQHCALRQQSILQDILPALKHGGILVYSTCTFNDKENKQNLDFFESLGVEWQPIPLDDTFGVTQEGKGYSFYPHKVKGEGFFIAVGILNKEEQIAFKTIHKPILKEFQNPFKDLNLKENWFCTLFENEIKIANSQMLETFSPLLGFMDIRKILWNWAEKKGNDFIPHYQSAFCSSIVCENIQLSELSHEEALKYLRKEDPGVHTEKGYKLVAYQNIPLGWIKNLGNRNNNLYPSQWRILSHRYDKEVFNMLA